MNMILLHKDEDERGFLAATDQRSQHIDKILKAKVGQCLKAGIIGGDEGEILLKEHHSSGWYFSFKTKKKARPLLPVTILLALNRPPVLKRLLKDFASLGCSQILLFPARLSEGDYQKSHFWQQIPQLLITGAQQGARTLLPTWQSCINLDEALQKVEPLAQKLWCDCLPATALIKKDLHWPLALAIGPERGWSTAERKKAAQASWQNVSLSSSILRCELAAQLALGTLMQRWEF